MLLNFIFCFVVSQASLAQGYQDFLLANDLLGDYFGVPGISASYDYVVVGGGTAGLTIARRLAAHASVAVIEAGDFYQFSNGNNSEVPAYASAFTGNDPRERNPVLDWYQYTQPQAGLNNKTFLYDSGKVLGGSSARSFMWHIRGSVGSFDKWASLVNDTAFQYKNLLPYFQRSNKYTAPRNQDRPSNASASFNESDWSATGGPIEIAYPAWVNPISPWLSLGFLELGLKALKSLTSGDLLGWAYIAMTLKPVEQVRSSSQAFLQDAMTNGDQLVVYKTTMATKIIFNGTSATGITVSTSGINYNIMAHKEIVVSAGVLLMVSGIGPAATLKSLQIPVLADLPGVGQNLWDSVLVGPTFTVHVTTHDSLAQPVFAAQAREQYRQSRSGILTNCGGDIAAFEKFRPGMLDNATLAQLAETFPEDHPDIVDLALDAYFGTGTDTSGGVNSGNQHVAASIGLVSTFSRGNVSIASSSVSQNPIIDPNWLLDPRDQKMAVAAFKRARQLFSTRSVKAVVDAEAYPGNNITTDEQILEIIRESANSVYDAVGTNKMGNTDDPMAVVDSQGRVFGVQNLRIVDASIFPFLPTTQPSATIYAVAEKIAEDILESMHSTKR